MIHKGPAPEVFFDRSIHFCLECDGEPEWPDAKDNDCFLCGADHSPLNAEANYFCRAHLDSDAVIVGEVDTPEDIQR